MIGWVGLWCLAGLHRLCFQGPSFSDPRNHGAPRRCSRILTDCGLLAIKLLSQEKFALLTILSGAESLPEYNSALSYFRKKYLLHLISHSVFIPYATLFRCCILTSAFRNVFRFIQLFNFTTFSTILPFILLTHFHPSPPKYQTDGLL
jgi:hypothetical protein